MEARDFVAQLIDSGLTQAQIAERTGIPQPTLSKILRGTVNDVLSRSYRKLQAVHAAVCVGGGKRGRKAAKPDVGQAV